MASHLVGQHQQTSFATPVNGAAGDATVVLGNDNATVTTYNAHDIDPTIHVQDSNAAVFAVTPAGTAGRKWMTNDTGGVYLYFDTGATWVEVNYQRTSSTGAVVIVSTSTPQVTVEYDGTHTSTFSVSSAGALTINATSTVTITPATTISGAVTHSSTLLQTGVATFTAQPILSSLTASQVVFTDSSKGLVSNAITGTGNVVMSASPTLTGTVAVASLTATGTVTVTGATITGLTAASVATGTFPGVYTITGALTLSAALTYGGVTLSNAVTGTGNMVLSASPTFTGTAAFATVTTSSTINGQTISSAASFTGTLTTALKATIGFATSAGVFNPAIRTVPATPGAVYWEVGNNGFNDFAIQGQGLTPSVILDNATGNVNFNSHALSGIAGLTVASGTTAVQALTATTVKIGSGSGATLAGGYLDVTTDIGITSTNGIVVGATRVLAFTTTGCTFNAGITATTGTFSSDISVATTKKVGLNAGLTSYLYESGAGVVDLVSSAVVRVFDAATQVALFDTGGVGSNTVGLSVYDKDNGGLKRVGVGASDSGGSGFRLLRVAN